MDSHSRKDPCDLVTLNSPSKNYDHDHKDIMFAVKQLKRYFTAEIIVAIFKHKDDLVAMGFTLEFIESLLIFGVGKNTVMDFRKSLDVNDKICEETTHQSEVVCHQSDLSRKEAGIVPIGVISVDQTVLSKLTEDEENLLASQCRQTEKGNLIILECKLCSYQSKSSKLMVRHLGCHDNGKCFTCSSCSYTTPFRSKWNQHKCRMSGDKRNLSCDTCQESFQTKAVLDHHVTTQHTDTNKSTATKMFVCDKCPYVGRDLSSLVDHQRKHTGDYLECTKPDCSFKTPYKRSLHKHLRQRHTTDKPLVCHVCGIQFKHAMSLSHHMKRHQRTTKRYKCSQCTFASHNSTDVVLHLQRKHLKEKRYSCSKCSFQTGYPMVLKKHLARHELEELQAHSESQRIKKKKQHSCSFCDKVFKTKSECVKHENSCNKMLLEHAESVTTAVTTNSMGVSDPKLCDVQVFDDQDVYPFDSHLETDISEEVFQITSNMLNHDDSGEDRTQFTAIVDDSLGGSVLTQDGYHTRVDDDNPITACKGRNPMLAETTRTLAAERDDSPLLGESLLSLMSDFPRPPPTNRCQSATTLMFASLSPHLVDRSLTPDFFSDNPSNSFFV